MLSNNLCVRSFKGKLLIKESIHLPIHGLRLLYSPQQSPPRGIEFQRTHIHLHYHCITPHHKIKIKITMAIEMDWSPDYCLSCDRQISQSGHGAYCSQSCRLADLERASSNSGSSSPTTAPTSSWQNSNMGTSAGFYLPPPLNFSAMSGRQSSSAASSPVSRSPLSSTPPNHYSTSPYASRPSQLYTSPSRTSLSSLNSYNGQQEPAVLSDKVKSELRDYASSFDHVRDWKRRMTVV